MESAPRTGRNPPSRESSPQKEPVAEVLSLQRSNRSQDAQSHGKVERRACLPDVGRRQIHGNVLKGIVQSAVLDGRADPLLALLDRGIRQSNGQEVGFPGGNIHLHLDQVGIDPQDGCTQRFKQHPHLQRLAAAMGCRPAPGRNPAGSAASAMHAWEDRRPA